MEDSISNDSTRTGFEPFQCRIDMANLRSFTEALSITNQLYADNQFAIELGYRDIPVPPTYPFVLEMLAGPGQSAICRELGFDPSRTVHTRQEFEWHGDLCGGDLLFGTTAVVSVISKGRIRVALLETSWKNRQMELVLISRTQLAERSEGTII